MTKATSEQYSDYSDTYKSVYGFRPRHEVSAEDIEAFFDRCFEPATPQDWDGRTVMVRMPKEWLAEQWGMETNSGDWQEAVDTGDFSKVR